MTRLGYQIPNFTYPGRRPGRRCSTPSPRRRRRPTGRGSTPCLVMDHFYQLPMLGPPEDYMLECYTTARGAGAGDVERSG